MNIGMTKAKRKGFSHLRSLVLDKSISTRFAFTWPTFVKEEVKLRYLSELREYLQKGVPEVSASD